MFFAKYASALALATSVVSACGPADFDGDSVQKQLRTTGYGSPNSRQAFGGFVNGTTVTGLYHSTTPRGDGMTSETGYWMRSADNDKYAPVTAMSYNGNDVSSVEASQGILQVLTGAGEESLQGAAFNLVFELGEPLNATLRVTKAIAATGGYTKYISDWSANGEEWTNYCPHPYVAITGVPTALTEYMIPVGGAKWGLNGARENDSAAIQLSCTHDSIGGCVNWGYVPWATVSQADGAKVVQVSLQNAHQACTRAKRADVCGDGDHLTTVNAGAGEYEHTAIQVWDAYNIHPVAEQTFDTMEASWGVNGALCVNPGEWRSNDGEYTRRLAIQLAREDCQIPTCSAENATGLISTSRICLDADDEGHCTSN